MQPRSRGKVWLRSADPNTPPHIDPGLVRDPDDLPRLFDGLRIARSIAHTEPLASKLDSKLDKEQWPGPHVQNANDLAVALRDPSASSRFTSYQHGVGTCRMGPNSDGPGSDRDAVANAQGAVYGIERLHVADASIMPAIPAANTNLPTMMLAERIAAMWL
jgi:choline dehydrogenase